MATISSTFLPCDFQLCDIVYQSHAKCHLLLLDGQEYVQVKGAECVVLAGDHKQLDPFVASDEAKRLGFSESLFERLQLCKIHRVIMSALMGRRSMQGGCVCCKEHVYMVPEQLTALSCSSFCSGNCQHSFARASLVQANHAMIVCSASNRMRTHLSS